LKPTDRHKVNVLSCVTRVILLLQSRAKVSAEERDCIEETIEIILVELEEIQVRLQFHPEVVKKISESLKSTAVSRRSRVGHIFGVPAASSELTWIVCRVQEKLAEEAIHNIHSNSVAKATSNNSVPKIRLTPPLASRKRITKGAQRASKGGRADKKSTSASTDPPAADDAAAGADA
jgi:hypothetical protein